VELVADGERGFVVAPTPESLAAALRRLMDDSALAEKLGQNGHDLARTITWPDTIDVLLGAKTAVQYSRPT
jgi:glycosyltransferase involved in cell wall biosynthesis